MKELFDNVSIATSRITTKSYSTSFSLGIRFLNKRFHNPIYAIYGFVRFADEIVDSFHEYNKADLLRRFREDTYRAIDEKISLNPILNSFQWVVNRYQIDRALIDTFLDSMEMDLRQHQYDQNNYEKYILGSAEVVGLMCLKVFVEGDEEKYASLKYYAMRLGAAFQKINFLRDMQADYKEMGRTYFPNVDLNEFNESVKKEIEIDIEKDFADGLAGIKMLPKSARLGVYVAYVYYSRLLQKIKQVKSSRVMQERIRIPDKNKYALFLGSYIRHSFNLL